MWALALSAAAFAGGPGRPGVSVPLYAVEHPCDDVRFPALAGPWVVGCDASGQVSVVQSLSSGRVLELPRPLEHAGVGPEVVLQTGRGGGFWRLAETGIERIEDATRVHQEPVAAPVSDGEHVAVLSSGHAQAFPLAERARKLFEARPAGWFPPALAWPWVAWVEAGEDVVWLDTRDGERAGDGDTGERHVVAQGGWMAWVEPEGVVVFDPKTGTREVYPAHTGFNAPPTLWEGVACWEERDADVDIRCSDGVAITGEGHQTWPQRWDPWLVYREGERLMLYTIP